jgi:hypothetical protein
MRLLKAARFPLGTEVLKPKGLQGAIYFILAFLRLPEYY